MHHLHTTRLALLLADSAALPSPLSGLVFTLLTGVLSPAELWHPATRVAGGRLVVGSATRPRSVPLPGATAAVLGPSEGALRSLLRIDHASGHQPSVLRAELEEAWPDAPPMEQLAMIAVHDLVACADGADERAAVLAYAGLRPRDASAGVGDLTGVASLIDRVVVAAGFRIGTVADMPVG